MLEPFSSMEALSARPAHLAALIHYILSEGVAEEEMVCVLCHAWHLAESSADCLEQLFYLNAMRLSRCPAAEDARQIFQDFIVTNAVRHDVTIFLCS